MEDLIVPDPKQYFEVISGCIHTSKDEAIQSLIHSSACDLFNILKSKNGEYCAQGNELLAREVTLLEAMDRLKTALENPNLLIAEYTLTKSKSK